MPSTKILFTSVRYPKYTEIHTVSLGKLSGTGHPPSPGSCPLPLPVITLQFSPTLALIICEILHQESSSVPRVLPSNISRMWVGVPPKTCSKASPFGSSKEMTGARQHAPATRRDETNQPGVVPSRGCRFRTEGSRGQNIRTSTGWDEVYNTHIATGDSTGDSLETQGNLDGFGMATHMRRTMQWGSVFTTLVG